LVIVQKVPNGTRGKLKLYLKPANTSSSQRDKRATRPAWRGALCNQSIMTQARKAQGTNGRRAAPARVSGPDKVLQEGQLFDGMG
jgi:hypothetical protein